MHEQELLSGSWNASWAANKAPFFIFLILRFFGWRAAHGVSMRTWFPCSCMTANSWIEQSRDAMQGTQQAFKKKAQVMTFTIILRLNLLLLKTCLRDYMPEEKLGLPSCFLAFSTESSSWFPQNAQSLLRPHSFRPDTRFQSCMARHANTCKSIINKSIKAGHVWVKSQTIFWNWAAIFGSQLLLLLFFLVQHDLLSHAALILVQASKAGNHQLHHLQSSLPFHQSVSREFYWDSFSRNFIAMKLFTIRIIQDYPPHSRTLS